MNNTPGSHLIAVPVVPSNTPSVTTVDLAPQKVVFGQKLQMTELPEMIAVETRFITHQVAMEASIVGTHDLQAEIKREVDESMAAFQLPIACNSIGVTAAPCVADVGIITESPHPTRERGQQTEKFVIPTASIGVQCKLEDELDVGDTVQMELAQGDNDGRQEFRQFVEEKTHEYSNGKQECLLCGEISTDFKTMKRHVALHWGPAVLCHRCGTELAHESLLRGHRCTMRLIVERKKRARRLRCPHFRCDVTAISELELYDHLNEHARLQPYQCASCQKSFATVGELKQHRMLRLRCFARAHNCHSPYARLPEQRQRLYRMRVYMAYTQHERRIVVMRRLTAYLRWDKKVRHCQICMRRCSGGRILAQHVKKCLKAFTARRKKDPVPQLVMSNGFNGVLTAKIDSKLEMDNF